MAFFFLRSLDVYKPLPQNKTRNLRAFAYSLTGVVGNMFSLPSLCFLSSLEKLTEEIVCTFIPDLRQMTTLRSFSLSLCDTLLDFFQKGIQLGIELCISLFLDS